MKWANTHNSSLIQFLLPNILIIINKKTQTYISCKLKTQNNEYNKITKGFALSYRNVPNIRPGLLATILIPFVSNIFFQTFSIVCFIIKYLVKLKIFSVDRKNPF